MTGRNWRALGAAILALGLPAAMEGAAHAKATFVINNMDSPGIGLNDTTPAAPVGNNGGTTLGQQRLNVFKAATDMWGRSIDSTVPIVVDVSFAPLACDQTRITLGQARATGFEFNRPGLPANMLFVEPLADRIAGVDLNPGEPDIEAMFNGYVDQCSGGLQDWYYGLDGKAPAADIELLSVILHELGHGLGFLAGADDQTGELAGGIMDAFTAHMFDNSLNNGAGLAWSSMTDAQRAASALNFRHLVWNGADVMKTAPKVLAKGMPSVTYAPALSGLQAAISEANFGPRAADAMHQGRLVVGTPIDGCAQPPNYAGAIVLFESGVCPSVQKSMLAQGAGAVAVLIAVTDGLAPPTSVEVPPDQNAQFPVTIPVLGVTLNDANKLASGASENVTVSGDATKLVGTDDQGRMYLYASNPILEGSTLSHWDVIARPNLMQEPNASYELSHDLRMEIALMHDIGWTPLCGNGKLDAGEECDNGASNSDTAPGACRTSCVKAACGDGVVDPNEQCDSGASNSNMTPGACRTNCMKPVCGDSIVDPGEECDSGASNSNTAPGACRTSCKKASCGDGVKDPGEQCDDAASNSDSAPSACRTSCKIAYCGDGVVDPGEQCDDGAKNAASAPCRLDCTKGASKSGCGCAVASTGQGGRADLGRIGGALALLVAGAFLRRRRQRRPVA